MLKIEGASNNVARDCKCNAFYNGKADEMLFRQSASGRPQECWSVHIILKLPTASSTILHLKKATVLPTLFASP